MSMEEHTRALKPPNKSGNVGLNGDTLWVSKGAYLQPAHVCPDVTRWVAVSQNALPWLRRAPVDKPDTVKHT